MTSLLHRRTSGSVRPAGRLKEVAARTWNVLNEGKPFTRLTSLLARQPIADAQTGFRALGRAALAVADIAHDYNYAQVLTLDLAGKGLRYADVPIRYRRRAQGRSFVTPGRYMRHVLPAMARAARAR